MHCGQEQDVPHWVAITTFSSSKKSPSPSRAPDIARAGVLFISLKWARMTCGASFPSACRHFAAAGLDRCPRFERILRFSDSG